MRTWMFGVMGLGLLGLGALPAAEQPAGACSLVDPCRGVEQEEVVDQVVVQLVRGDVEATVPVFPEEVRLVMDGYGELHELWLDDGSVMSLAWGE